jgi:hypothetical protein
MNKIKFDGTVGIMSCKINGKCCMAIKENIGNGFGKKVDNPKYKKGQVCDARDFDIIFEFVSPKSINSMIKVLKNVKEQLQEKK